ncbi:MAG TPA: hypothetical protein VMV22_08230 [Acidimicrobiales bacterium]|nr:hypothetical protein [Acidimicrobiales bacterium]
MTMVVAVGFFISNGISGENVAAATNRLHKTQAVIYGDSLTWESTKYIARGFLGNTTYRPHVHAYPGSAPCDWVEWLPADIAKYHPTVISLTTVGNNTTACTMSNGQQLDAGSQALQDNYRTALTGFFSTAIASGARVIFNQGPPVESPVGNAWVNEINLIAAQLAPNYGGKVTISSAARLSVSNNGVFTTTLPCLAGENKKDGCSAGVIDVRTVSGDGVGVHLCRNGFVGGTFRKPCDVYSSGEVRFGAALAQAIRNP